MNTLVKWENLSWEDITTEFHQIFNSRVHVSCGDGWKRLIACLCCDLQHITDLTGVQVIADDVKEKFGGLRFYYHTNSEYTKLARMYHGIESIFYRYGFGKQCNKLNKHRKKLFSTTEEKIADLVRVAEHKSFTVCETCGAPGKVYRRGWIYTACETCHIMY